MEDLTVTQGQELWDAFVEAVDQGTPAAVRVVFYYTPDPDQEPLDASPEYDSSAFYVKEISFDGNRFTLVKNSRGKEVTTQEYLYLLKFEEVPEGVRPSRIQYFLTRDNTLTLRDLTASFDSNHPPVPLAEHDLAYYNTIPKPWPLTPYPPASEPGQS